MRGGMGALCPPWLPSGRAPEVPEEGSSCIACDHLSHLGGTQTGTRSPALRPGVQEAVGRGAQKLMATLTASVNQTHSASASLLLLTIHPDTCSPSPHGLPTHLTPPSTSEKVLSKPITAAALGPQGLLRGKSAAELTPMSPPGGLRGLATLMGHTHSQAGQQAQCWSNDEPCGGALWRRAGL